MVLILTDSVTCHTIDTAMRCNGVSYFFSFLCRVGPYSKCDEIRCVPPPCLQLMRGILIDELDIERDLRQLYIPDNYKSKALQTRISNPVFQIMISYRYYKSVDDNSC